MKPNRSDRILDDWASVARSARRPDAAPRRTTQAGGLPLATLTGAAVILVAVAIAGVLIGRPGPSDVAAVSPSAPTPTIGSSIVPTPVPSTAGGPIACAAADLQARITTWEGAAGSRIATVRLTSHAQTACLVDDLARPQLVDANGILIDGSAPAATTPLIVEPGGVLETLVSAGNDCGPAPVAPVSVAFVLSNGDRLVAEPVSPTDATVPPCNGPSQPATISMHKWAAA